MTAFERQGGNIHHKGNKVIAESQKEREDRLLRKEFISNIKTAIIIGLSVGIIFLMSAVLI